MEPLTDPSSNVALPDPPQLRSQLEPGRSVRFEMSPESIRMLADKYGKGDEESERYTRCWREYFYVRDKDVESGPKNPSFAIGRDEEDFRKMTENLGDSEMWKFPPFPKELRKAEYYHVRKKFVWCYWDGEGDDCGLVLCMHEHSKENVSVFDLHEEPRVMDYQGPQSRPNSAEVRLRSGDRVVIQVNDWPLSEKALDVSLTYRNVDEEDRKMKMAVEGDAKLFKTLKILESFGESVKKLQNVEEGYKVNRTCAESLGLTLNMKSKETCAGVSLMFEHRKGQWHLLWKNEGKREVAVFAPHLKLDFGDKNESDEAKFVSRVMNHATNKVAITSLVSLRGKPLKHAMDLSQFQCPLCDQPKKLQKEEVFQHLKKNHETVRSEDETVRSEDENLMYLSGSGLRIKRGFEDRWCLTFVSCIRNYACHIADEAALQESKYPLERRVAIPGFKEFLGEDGFLGKLCSELVEKCTMPKMAIDLDPSC